MGIVEVSRSIGDGRFKLCGIISVPDILRCQLTENDKLVSKQANTICQVIGEQSEAKFAWCVLHICPIMYNIKVLLYNCVVVERHTVRGWQFFMRHCM